VNLTKFHLYISFGCTAGGFYLVSPNSLANLWHRSTTSPFSAFFFFNFQMELATHSSSHLLTCHSLNRYSMPVTKSRNGMHEMLSLDQTNTTRFLFGDDDIPSTSDPKSYLQMHATDDNFPILVRREELQQQQVISIETPYFSVRTDR
jgi:hypothetical protein